MAVWLHWVNDPFITILTIGRMIMKRIILSLAAVSLLTFAIHAQTYSIDWHKVAGGGGASSNGQYLVNGTIGQHDAGGPMTGGGFSLTGGFWSLFAVQTPGAPLLRIQMTATNTVLLAWPASSAGFALQQSTDAAAMNWMTVTNAWNVVGGENQVMVSTPNGNQFYRLKK